MALDMITGKVFAVKTVESLCLELLSALENERSILCCITSNRVIQYLGEDWTTEDGLMKRNLHLEFIPGGNLLDVMKGSPKPFTELLIQQYTRGILEGLRDIHKLGIVHSDIKCKNVLLGIDGVKLCDFGSAEILGRSNGVNRLRGPVGTLYWMPPELVTGGVIDSTAGDIWSLGCTVIEMATGGNPWGDQSALYSLRCTNAVPTFPTGLSPQGQHFLSLCLQRDPKKRPSAEALLSHPFLMCKKQHYQLNWQLTDSQFLKSLREASEEGHSEVQSCKGYQIKEDSLPVLSSAESNSGDEVPTFQQFFQRPVEPMTLKEPLRLRLDCLETGDGTDSEYGGDDFRSPGSWSWWSSPSSPMGIRGNWLKLRSPVSRTTSEDQSWAVESTLFEPCKSFTEVEGGPAEHEKHVEDGSPTLCESLTFKGML